MSQKRLDFLHDIKMDLGKVSKAFSKYSSILCINYLLMKRRILCRYEVQRLKKRSCSLCYLDLLMSAKMVEAKIPLR